MAATQEVSEAVLAFTEHEHRDLARGVDRIHDVGCSVGVRPSTELLPRVREVLTWFDRELEPHLAWEESWLYPRIEDLTGTPWATRAARYDHGQLREVIERVRAEEMRLIRSSSPTVQAELRCRLFSLEALLRAHIDREERLLMPVLLDGAGSPGHEAGARVGPAADPDVR